MPRLVECLENVRWGVPHRWPCPRRADESQRVWADHYHQHQHKQLVEENVKTINIESRSCFSRYHYSTCFYIESELNVSDLIHDLLSKFADVKSENPDSRSMLFDCRIPLFAQLFRSSFPSTSTWLKNSTIYGHNRPLDIRRSATYLYANIVKVHLLST
jgi:hypothetical protein